MTRCPMCLVLAAALLGAGCGKTKQDVINDYRGRMNDRRAELGEIAWKLPAPGGAPDRRAAPEPPPAFGERGGNTAFLAVEQLQDPDAKPAFDFNLGAKLDSCLRWAGPNNPMAESARRSAAGTLAKDFDEALAYRYLGVLRTLDYQKPAVVDAKTFRGGALELEVLFVDLQSKQVLTAFRVSARPDPTVTVTFKEGESREARAEEYVRSALWSNARKQIAQGLAERTGGTFALGP